MKEEAQAYEPPQTLNIADLDKIPIDMQLLNGDGKNKKDEVFKYKYALIDGQEYRVPGTVLGGIKSLLKKFPNLKEVQVLKSGAGLNTLYQVIPYQEPEQPSGGTAAAISETVK